MTKKLVSHTISTAADTFPLRDIYTYFTCYLYILQLSCNLTPGLYRTGMGIFVTLGYDMYLFSPAHPGVEAAQPLIRTLCVLHVCG